MNRTIKTTDVHLVKLGKLWRFSITPLTGQPRHVEFTHDADAVTVLTSLFDGVQVDAAAPKAPKHPDPWIQEVYDLTTGYHVRTGNKCQMSDILDAFFAQTVYHVDADDRDAFMSRLKERLV